MYSYDSPEKHVHIARGKPAEQPDKLFVWCCGRSEVTGPFPMTPRTPAARWYSSTLAQIARAARPAPVVLDVLEHVRSYI